MLILSILGQGKQGTNTLRRLCPSGSCSSPLRRWQRQGTLRRRLRRGCCSRRRRRGSLSWAHGRHFSMNILDLRYFSWQSVSPFHDAFGASLGRILKLYWIATQDPYIEDVQVEEEDVEPLVEDPGGGERKRNTKMKCEYSHTGRVSHLLVDLGCVDLIWDFGVFHLLLA